jgi:8-oxo-dGTP diphosphatase
MKCKKIVKALLFYDNNLLLLERSKTKFHGMEDLPGGKLEPDELPIPGLIREIKEETALEVNRLHHFATHEWQEPDGTNYIEYIYYSFVDTKQVILNPNEHSSYSWVPLEYIEQSKNKRGYSCTYG